SVARQVGGQQRRRPGRGLVAQVQGGHDGVAHQRRVEDFGELHQPPAAAEPAAEFGGGPDRQAGLAAPAGPDEADQAGLGELLPDFGELAAAADEAGRFGGQISPALGGPCPDICIRPPPPRPPRRRPPRTPGPPRPPPPPPPPPPTPPA